MRADGELRLPGAIELRPCEDPDRIGLITAGGRLFHRSWTTGSGPPAVEAPQGDAPPADAEDPEDERIWRTEEATCLARGPAVLVGSACGEVVLLRDGERIAVQAHQTEVADVAWLSDGAVASLGTDGTCLRWRPDGQPAADDQPLPSSGTPPDLQPEVDRLAEAPLEASTLVGLAARLAGASSRGVTVLRACLQDPRPRVRYRTLWLIGEDGLWGFAHELATALHDPNETVRRAAVGAIDALDEVACTDPLRELLERETDESVGALAAEVVERFARPFEG